MVIYGSELIMIYPHPANIDSHNHCVGGYIFILVFRFILQDGHVSLRLEFTQGKSSSFQAFWP